MSVTLNASNSGSGGFIVTPDSSGVLAFQTAGTTALTLDTNQNMGLGVTPSAWSQGKALEIFSTGYGLWNGSGSPSSIYVLNNTYFNGGFKYAGNGQATTYYQYQGQHVWNNAPNNVSGSGAAATFTQAMTLDASGNLGLGTTTPTSTYSSRVAIVPASSSAALSVDAASGNNTGINFYNNAVIKWTTQVLTTGEYRWYDFTASAERMRIDSSGNLLTGTTSLGTTGVNSVSLAASTSVIRFTNATASTKEWSFGTSTPGVAGVGDFLSVGRYSGSAWAEFTRIDSSGNLLVGQTSKSQTTVGFYAAGDTTIGSTSSCMAASTSAATTWNTYSTGAAAYRFYVDLGGTIHATSTTITAISSDERLKQNIVDYNKGLSQVLALRPRSFEYKSEPGRVLSGFISQEVQTVMPEVIEPTMEDPDMLTYAIDWYPLLVKAIQEQQTLITTLTNRITALEAKGA